MQHNTLPEAALVAAAVVSEAMCAFVEDELLCAIPPGRGADWLQLEGWGQAELAAAEPAAQPLNIRQEEIVQRWQRRWGLHEERLIWLVTMLVMIERPALAADKNLPAKAARWLAFAYNRVRTASQAHVDPSPSLRDKPTPAAEAQVSESSGEGSSQPIETIGSAHLKRQHSSLESLPTECRI